MASGIESTTEAITKADAPLHHALLEAKEDERLRVILFLDDKKDQDSSVSGNVTRSAQPGISIKDYESRTKFREALIEQRQGFLEDRLGETLKQFEELSIDVHTKSLSRTVVADGLARDILKALALPGVLKATLDTLQSR